MCSLGVINLNFSNSKSFCNILDNLKMKYKIVHKSSEIKNFEKIILPGTGSFKNAILEMESKNFSSEIIKHCLKKKLFLGICLGMQVLFSNGYEGGSITNGLNLIEGEVIKLISNKIPIIHIGWNEITTNDDIPILKDITEDENFYFMHGYHAETCELVKKSYTNFRDQKILSIVNKENLYGIQFHQKKSYTRKKNIKKLL